MSLPVVGEISCTDFNNEFGRTPTAQLRFSQMYRGGGIVPANRINITGWNNVAGQGFEPGGGGQPDPATGIITGLQIINVGQLPSNTTNFNFGGLPPSIGRNVDLNITLGGSGNNGFVSSWSIASPGFGFAVNDRIQAGFLVPGPGGFTAPEWRVTAVNTPPVVPNPEFLYSNSGGFIAPPNSDFFWRVRPGELRINWARNFFGGTAFFSSFSSIGWPSQGARFCFGPGNPEDPYDNYRYERGALQASSGGWDFYSIKRRPVQPVGSNTPVNTGVPTAGQIGFSNMRGAENT